MREPLDMSRLLDDIDKFVEDSFSSDYKNPNYSTQISIFCPFIISPGYDIISLYFY